MLLEAVVALAIISLVAVGVLGLVAGQTRVAYKASVLLVAASLAEERIETLRLLEYYDLVDLPDSLRAGIFPEPLDEFAWVASARLLEDEYDLFSVEVTVFSEDEAFPLQTLIFRERALEEPVVQGSAQMPLPSGPGGPGG